MAGRIVTLQTHLCECPTNYAGLIAMRCNIDVQDLRRVLLWMTILEINSMYPNPCRQFSACLMLVSGAAVIIDRASCVKRRPSDRL